MDKLDKYKKSYKSKKAHINYLKEQLELSLGQEVKYQNIIQ